MYLFAGCVRGHGDGQQKMRRTTVRNGKTLNGIDYASSLANSDAAQVARRVRQSKRSSGGKSEWMMPQRCSSCSPLIMQQYLHKEVTWIDNKLIRASEIVISCIPSSSSPAPPGTGCHRMCCRRRYTSLFINDDFHYGRVHVASTAQLLNTKWIFFQWSLPIRVVPLMYTFHIFSCCLCNFCFHLRWSVEFCTYDASSIDSCLAFLHRKHFYPFARLKHEHFGTFSKTDRQLGSRRVSGLWVF